MVRVIENVLTREELQKFRSDLDAANWGDGRQTAGHIAIQAKNNQQLADNDPLAISLGEYVLSRLGANEAFMTAALPLKILPPRFNRYSHGSVYANHIDSAVFSVPGTPHRIRSDLSATLFLSDPDEYDGGDLIIATEGGRCSVKLAAGHMVLYPGNTLHQVTAVTRGARLAAFFWIQSLVREGERRAMLWELDDSIQAISTKLTNDPAVTRLVGLYHNLLRHWSNT